MIDPQPHPSCPDSLFFVPTTRPQLRPYPLPTGPHPSLLLGLLASSLFPQSIPYRVPKGSFYASRLSLSFPYSQPSHGSPGGLRQSPSFSGWHSVPA